MPMVMEKNRKLLHEEGEGSRNPFALAVLSLLVGAVAGAVGAVFRIECRASTRLAIGSCFSVEQTTTLF
jgi:hypothetical protein